MRIVRTLLPTPLVVSSSNESVLLRRSFWRRECAHALEEANEKAERAVPETVRGAARRRMDVTCVGCAAWR